MSASISGRKKEKLAHLWTSLQKEAAQLLWDAQGLSYDELVNRLRKRSRSRGEEERYQAELRYRGRIRDEGIRELAQDVRRLLALAYPREQSHIGRDAFLAALNDQDFELRVRDRDPPDLETAVRLAQRFEISRGVVGASFTPARRAAPQIFDDLMVSQGAGSSTAGVFPGRVSPVSDLESMMRSIAEQTVA